MATQNLLTLLASCKQQNPAAQEKMYSSYFPYAMSIAFRYSSSYENAVEMANDAFLKLFGRLDTFSAPTEHIEQTFTAWFRRVVRNACIDHLRKYQQNNVVSVAEFAATDLLDRSPSSECHLGFKEIMRYVDRLPAGHRAVFDLFVFEGYSHVEIARTLKISEESSKTTLFRARQQLKRVLNKGCNFSAN